MHRRSFMAAAALAPLVPSVARSQDAYPTHGIRIVVGFPPGQASDLTARLLSARLTQELGQSVYVENKPGAAGILAHEQVKAAKPDGYTLMVGSTATLAINPSLYRKLPYDPLKDFVPIAQLSATPLFLVGNNELPVRNFREMVEYVRARPGKLSYGSAGSGTSSHIVMESLKKEAGLDIVHIPFKGSPEVLTALIAGNVQFCFDTSSALTAYVNGGKVRALATSTAQRVPSFPDLATVVEQGQPGFVFGSWSALLAPAGTPPAIVEKLNAAINQALKDKDVLAYYQKAGVNPTGGTSAAIQQYMREETVAWARAVAASGARAD